MPDRTQTAHELRVSYLCLEQSQEGSAADAHLKGFFDDWPTGSLTVTRAAHHSDDSSLSKLMSIVSAYWRFIAFSSRADAMGARAHPFVLPSFLIGKMTGKKTFLFLSGRPSDFPNNSLYHRAMGRIGAISFRGALRFADVVFATSAGLADWARTESQSKIVRVTNGVDIKRFKWPVGERSGVVFVGTPAPWQGLTTLLDAAASAQWPDEMSLTVIGAPAPEGASNSARVVFLGHLTPSEVARVLSKNSIGVSPKRLDQATILGVSPFKLAEYHGAGLAVLASDVPGQREMISASQGGALFSPDSAEELAAAVRRWHADPDELRATQSRARSYAERELAWSAQRQKVINALRGLL